MNKILFINGSPNKDGNTAALAKLLLEGQEYETLALCDYQMIAIETFHHSAYGRTDVVPVNRRSYYDHIGIFHFGDDLIQLVATAVLTIKIDLIVT